MRRINRSKERRDALREAAEAASERWQALSPAEQLKKLDSRLGDGVGASKQRKKIAAKLEEAQRAKKAQKPAKKTGKVK